MVGSSPEVQLLHLPGSYPEAAEINQAKMSFSQQIDRIWLNLKMALTFCFILISVKNQNNSFKKWNGD